MINFATVFGVLGIEGISLVSFLLMVFPFMDLHNHSIHDFPSDQTR